MPYANQFALGSDALDDPVIFDLCPSFDGGMVSNVRANLLQENQAALLINCEIARNGEISTRRGSTLLGSGHAGTGTFIQGITYFETPTYSYPVVVNGAKLYSFDGANWNNFAAAFTATSSANKIGFAQGVDKLYFSELGVGHIYQWDGAALTDVGATDINTDPPRAPTFMVWHTGRLVVAGGQFVGVDVPDALTFSQYLTAGYSSTSFNWDRTKWSLRVGTGEGDPITGLYSWLDFNLIVFKRHSIWVVNCDPALQLADVNNTIVGFQTKPVHKRIGCIAPWTAAQVGSDVFFLATDGVRSIKRVLAAETQTETSPAISLPIQDYINRINQAYASTSVATFYDNKYILAAPLDNATSPNYLFVYDTLNQSWSGLWTGWLPTGFAIRNVTGEPGRMIFGQNDGNVLEFLSYIQVTNETDTHFKDNGVDIATMIKTRAMTFGEFILRKEGLNCEFEFNLSTAEATCQIVIDDSGNQAFESFTTSGGQTLLPQTLPFTLSTAGVVRSSRDLQRYGLFRELQFYLTTTAQKLVLRALGASAFHLPMQIQHD